MTFDSIPSKMRTAWRFVVWRYEQRDGRTTKVLYDAKTGRRASSINPGTWATFEEACAALASGRYDGIGFVLGDVFAAVDLDKCRHPQTGALSVWAVDIVARLDSYTEVSPSGTGLHVFVLVDPTQPIAGRKKTWPDGSALEIYGAGRYFTLTGDVVGTATLAERDQALRALVREHFDPSPTTADTCPSWAVGHEGAEVFEAIDLPRSVADISDDDLLARMFAAENGNTVRALFDGDTRGDHSVADLALCSHLAFWTQRDAVRIDRIFRRSHLMRGKWNRADYRARTIERAIKDSAIYEPPVVPLVADADEAEAL
jgi:putative DNA primase/helicase